MTIIYIAGPLFNSHERAYLEQIAAVIERAGYETFLPHRDAGLLTQITPETRQQIFRADLKALEACDGCVALLTGADHDSGTCGEIGYLYAKGKPCIGITDDVRWLNNLIWGLCGEGQRLVRHLDDLLPLLQTAVTLK
jgi:nucleoside 2-deoxyribosyltransferase